MKYLLKILNNWSIVDVADNLGVKLLSLDFSLHKDVSTQAFFLAFCLYNYYFVYLCFEEVQIIKQETSLIWCHACIPDTSNIWH